MSVTELFDLTDRAIASGTRGRWRLWHSGNKTVLWLAQPTVTIGAHEWYAQYHGRHEFGYSLRQARQMRAALLELLAPFTQRLESQTERWFRETRPPDR